ncbi:hypothetical protein Dimus_004314, partial [Dionaea muscipula]
TQLINPEEEEEEEEEERRGGPPPSLEHRDRVAIRHQKSAGCCFGFASSPFTHPSNFHDH